MSKDVTGEGSRKTVPDRFGSFPDNLSLYESFFMGLMKGSNKKEGERFFLYWS